MIATYIPATVEVSLTIGKGGVPQKISYSTSNALLRAELEYFFKTKTTYREACQGKVVTFVVRYLVEGSPVDDPTSEVRLEPPNRFTVVCRPLNPILDPPQRPE